MRLQDKFQTCKALYWVVFEMYPALFSVIPLGMLKSHGKDWHDLARHTQIVYPQPE